MKHRVDRVYCLIIKAFIPSKISIFKFVKLLCNDWIHLLPLIVHLNVFLFRISHPHLGLMDHRSKLFRPQTLVSTIVSYMNVLLPALPMLIHQFPFTVDFDNHRLIAEGMYHM